MTKFGLEVSLLDFKVIYLIRTFTDNRAPYKFTIEIQKMLKDDNMTLCHNHYTHCLAVRKQIKPPISLKQNTF